MLGAFLLWYCLGDTGWTDPPAGTFWLARNVPDWVKREMAEAAERRGLFNPELEGLDYGSFDGVVYIFYRRAVGKPLDLPADPGPPRVQIIP